MKENTSTYQIENDLDIKGEIQKYARHWVWFVLSALVCLVAAFIYLRYSTPIYKTSAKIEILDVSEEISMPGLDDFFGTSRINLENGTEVIHSTRLLTKVVKELDLTTQYFSKGRLIESEAWINTPFTVSPVVSADNIQKSESYFISTTEQGYVFENANGFKTTINTKTLDKPIDSFPFLITAKPLKALSFIEQKYRISFSSTATATAQLLGGLKVSPVGKESQILSLELSGSNTQKSEAVLNDVIKQFDLDGIQDRQVVSQRTIDFVDNRFVYLTEELDSVEGTKKDFKAKNSIVYIEADAQSSILNKTISENELFAVEQQLALAELLGNSLKNNKKLLPVNIGIESNGINSLITTYNVAVLERDKLILSAGENNPTVLASEASLSELRINIKNTVLAYTSQLNLTLKKLQSKNKIASGVVYSMPEKEKLLRSIERQQKTKEALYLLLLQKREEAAISLAITAPSVKVVDYAITDTAPVSPKRQIIYLAALLLGVLIPFGILYIIFLLDTKVHNKQDLEKVFSEVPIMAEIPEIKDDKLFLNPQDRTILSEAFRILSTNVDYVSPKKTDGVAKIIYVTSTIKGEGKTFVALNLALAFASLNKRVLIIGADLRNPQIHSYFNGDKNKKGLSDYMHDSSTNWTAFLQKKMANSEYLDILLSGTIPPNPASLLTNGSFGKLIAEAKQKYDYVVVDTAPTILVTDTLLIAEHADTTVYVTRANHTDKKLLAFSKDLHEKKKLTNMALVVNDVSEGKSSFYGYGYGYNYGYGYGYDEEKTKTSWFKRIFK